MKQEFEIFIITINLTGNNVIKQTLIHGGNKCNTALLIFGLL